ncbi:MAG TPA: DUF4397 domain-containing protein [Gemmatimonadales bacterium]|nr:DUF4397 domain-containing protein [Gemmatimonadales bacterium]
MPASLRSAALLATACSVLSACGSSGEPAGGEATLRVLHASPALGPVDVSVAGVTVAHGIVYGTASALVRVPGGQQHLEVRANGQLLGALDPLFSLQHVNGIAVVNGAPQWLSEVTPDTGQSISNRANVRMVNVVGSNTQPPTLLDVLVHAPNANPDSVIKFGMDATIASYGTLMYFDPGHFSFSYVPRGGSTVLAQVSFDVAAGEKKAVVLQRAADGTYSAQVVIEQ